MKRCSETSQNRPNRTQTRPPRTWRAGCTRAPVPAIPQLRGRYALTAGRFLEVPTNKADTGEIHVVGRDGCLELRIRITEEGSVVNVAAARMHLQSSGCVSVACSDFQVETEGNITMRAGRDASIRAQGALTQRAESVTLEGQAARIEATRTDLILKANDIVRAIGEQIWLNSEMSQEDKERAIRNFVTQLIRPAKKALSEARKTESG